MAYSEMYVLLIIYLMLVKMMASPIVYWYIEEEFNIEDLKLNLLLKQSSLEYYFHLKIVVNGT